MDPLTALRTAIMAGKDTTIHVEGDQLDIDGERYPLFAETAFKVTKTNKKYKLLSLWLRYVTKDKAFADYMKVAYEHKLSMQDLVLVTDTKIVIEYLTGANAAIGHIDVVALSTAPTGGEETSHSAGTSAHEVVSLDMSIAREVLQQSRSSVLDIPGTIIGAVPAVGKALKDKLYTILASVTGSDSAENAAADGVSGKKRPRPTSSAGGSGAGPSGSVRQVKPIIVVPAATTSLINKYNALAFLQDGQYVTPEQAQAANPVKPDDIIIRRKDGRGNAMQYRVIDDVSGLKTYEDWARVVAVFAQGPEWQFKGWRWGRTPERPDVTPAEIFNRCVGCHLMYEGDTIHDNIAKWNVKPLMVSRTKRYLDAGIANQFWSLVDGHIFTHKPRLLPQSDASASGAGVTK